MIRFIVPGQAVPQQRTGRTVINGRIVSYDPQKSRDFKQLVRMVAYQHAPQQLLDGPLIVTIDVIKDIPKSYSVKRRQAAIEGKIRPTSKPDNTNYAKGIEDALNKVIWNDDSSIVTLVVRKWYGERPRTIVHVTPCAEGEETPPSDE